MMESRRLFRTAVAAEPRLITFAELTLKKRRGRFDLAALKSLVVVPR